MSGGNNILNSFIVCGMQYSVGEIFSGVGGTMFYIIINGWIIKMEDVL